MFYKDSKHYINSESQFVLGTKGLFEVTRCPFPDYILDIVHPVFTYISFDKNLNLDFNEFETVKEFLDEMKEKNYIYYSIEVDGKNNFTVDSKFTTNDRDVFAYLEECNYPEDFDVTDKVAVAEIEKNLTKELKAWTDYLNNNIYDIEHFPINLFFNNNTKEEQEELDKELNENYRSNFYGECIEENGMMDHIGDIVYVFPSTFDDDGLEKIQLALNDFDTFYDDFLSKKMSVDDLDEILSIEGSNGDSTMLSKGEFFKELFAEEKTEVIDEIFTTLFEYFNSIK